MPRHPSEALSRLIVLTKAGRASRAHTEAADTSLLGFGLDEPGPTGPQLVRYSPDDVFMRSPLQTACAAGLTLPSQCHLGAAGASCTPAAPRTCSLDHVRRQPPRYRPAPRGAWWSQTGSNRRPHACKARALPTELWPQKDASGLSLRIGAISSALRRLGIPKPPGRGLVGPGGLEPPTSRLSGVCSNQLSYRPEGDKRS